MEKRRIRWPATLETPMRTGRGSEAVSVRGNALCLSSYVRADEDRGVILIAQRLCIHPNSDSARGPYESLKLSSQKVKLRE